MERRRIEVKFPCRNCKYFEACGDKDRAKPCDGREKKAKERKGNKK